MRIEPMKGLEDVLLIHPDLHEDERGYFYEVFNEKEFNEKTGGKYDFHALQENESKSKAGVFRGLHFQKAPYEQAKLVRVLKGAVIDFAVDIRKDSSTFGKCVFAILTEENKNQFFIPRGFAHGFYVTAPKVNYLNGTVDKVKTIFEYKCDNYYNKESEGGIVWNDKDIVVIDQADSYFGDLYKNRNIEDWLTLSIATIGPVVLSEKDKNRITTLKDL